MSEILILYSTVDGHTLKICERLRRELQRHGHRVTLASMDAQIPTPGDFDKVVIGASIRYGKHRPNVAQFMRAHAQALSARPSAFFSVNIVARKPNKNTPQTNPYVRKFLRLLPWRPRELAVFAGKLDYPRYRFWDRQIIRFIMLLTKGPVDPKTVIEFTDWQEVDRFARTLSDMQ